MVPQQGRCQGPFPSLLNMIISKNRVHTKAIVHICVSATACNHRWHAYYPKQSPHPPLNVISTSPKNIIVARQTGGCVGGWEHCSSFLSLSCSVSNLGFLTRCHCHRCRNTARSSHLQLCDEVRSPVDGASMVSLRWSCKLSAETTV